MTDAREKMLAAIRLKIGNLPGRDNEKITARLRSHPRHLIPARVNISPSERVLLFQKQAELVGTRVISIADDELEATLKTLLSERGIRKIKISASDVIEHINWQAIEVTTGAATTHDFVSVTGCFCAVAETGTLVFAADKTTPTTLLFLPEIHIVILHEDAIVGCYEDAWDKMRERASPPRCLHLITGPSRTGDIEQKILMGAHGPRELWVVLLQPLSSRATGSTG